MQNKLPEVWLRGLTEGVHPLLNPVAATLSQVYEELKEILLDFPENKLWIKPLGMASIGFHLRHLTGVLDRLFTYARAEKLNTAQFDFLNSEGLEPETPISSRELLAQFKLQVDNSILQLKSTPIEILTHTRKIGRQELPSTVLGLYFHAAEHATRHLGQILVTVILLNKE